MKIKPFIFPSFEEWEERENNVRIIHGAYCCEIRAFSWCKHITTYMFAVSLANKNPLNAYTEKLFCMRFEFEGNYIKLKEWYEEAISEFNAFWENHIRSTYLYEE